VKEAYVLQRLTLLSDQTDLEKKIWLIWAALVAKLDVLARFKGGEEGRSRKTTRIRLHFARSELGNGFVTSPYVI
jgi:hypothetical protein